MCAGLNLYGAPGKYPFTKELIPLQCFVWPLFFPIRILIVISRNFEFRSDNFRYDFHAIALSCFFLWKRSVSKIPYQTTYWLSNKISIENFKTVQSYSSIRILRWHKSDGLWSFQRRQIVVIISTFNSRRTNQLRLWLSNSLILKTEIDVTKEDEEKYAKMYLFCYVLLD